MYASAPTRVEPHTAASAVIAALTPATSRSIPSAATRSATASRCQAGFVSPPRTRHASASATKRLASPTAIILYGNHRRVPLEFDRNLYHQLLAQIPACRRAMDRR